MNFAAMMFFVYFYLLFVYSFLARLAGIGAPGLSGFAACRWKRSTWYSRSIGDGILMYLGFSKLKRWCMLSPPCSPSSPGPTFLDKFDNVFFRIMELGKHRLLRAKSTVCCHEVLDGRICYKKGRFC